MNIQTAPKPQEIEAVLGLDRRGKGRRLVRRGLWLVVILGILAAGSWWYRERTIASQTVSYDTVEARRADLVIAVTATGKIEPTTQVDISSEMSGVVRSVLVANNSTVKAGDILADLDTASFAAQRDRAKATLASAEAQIESAKATLKETELALTRAETLRKKGLSPAQELDQARAANDRAAAALAVAQSQALVAKSDLDIRETDLVKSRIVSPINGVVLSRQVEPGQTVASSLSAPVLFTLAEDLTRMQVVADVDEADIGAVKEGQPATFTVEAYPEREFPAEIATIEFSPKTTENVVTYSAVLRVDNNDLALRPGMTATARIVVKDIKQALTVPNSAFRYAPPKVEEAKGFSLTNLFMPRFPRFERSSNNRPANGERVLWVLENGQPREVKVKTGASDGQNTEIISGEIGDGASIIVASKQGGA
jgi:HlyD family secretion protein